MGLGSSQDKASERSEKINIEGTEKRSEVKFPHNYEAILKDADLPIDKSSTEKLYDQLYGGVFLNKKRKKYWVEKNSDYNSFMLFARELSITWAEDSQFWHWPYFPETNDVLIDVAEVVNVCWLEIHGKFETSNLSPGVTYEVAFVVMLRDPSYGWEVPVNFRLILPDGSRQEHKENLMEKVRGQWIEIPAGEFTTSSSSENVGDQIEFSLYDYEGGKWKRGLVVKGVVFRPKS